MWHSLTIFLLCAVTNVMYWLGVQQHGPYMAPVGHWFGDVGAFFWNWRRRGGPVTFVERQMAHAWVAGVVASVGAFTRWRCCYGCRCWVVADFGGVPGMVFLFKAARCRAGFIRGGGDFFDGGADGTVSGGGAAVVWGGVGGELLCAGVEVLSAASAGNAVGARDVPLAVGFRF